MNKYKEGITLVEVLIASVILAVALIPLLSVLNINLKGASHTKNLRVAINLAREEIEKVKSLSYKEEEIESVKYEKIINNVNWKIEREVVPTSDPLQIWVRVYREEEAKPVITLFTLKENLTWP